MKRPEFIRVGHRWNGNVSKLKKGDKVPVAFTKGWRSRDTYFIVEENGDSGLVLVRNEKSPD